MNQLILIILLSVSASSTAIAKENKIYVTARIAMLIMNVPWRVLMPFLKLLNFASNHQIRDRPGFLF